MQTFDGIVALLFGDKAQAVLAGAAGGIVRWLTLRENWRDGAVSIVVGALCALYLSPMVEPLLEPALGRIVLDPARRAGFSGFLIGIGGIAAAGFIIDIWQIRRAQLRRPPGEGGGP